MVQNIKIKPMSYFFYVFKSIQYQKKETICFVFKMNSKCKYREENKIEIKNALLTVHFGQGLHVVVRQETNLAVQFAEPPVTRLFDYVYYGIFLKADRFRCGRLKVIESHHLIYIVGGQFGRVHWRYFNGWRYC